MVIAGDLWTFVGQVMTDVPHQRKPALAGGEEGTQDVHYEVAFSRPE